MKNIRNGNPKGRKLKSLSLRVTNKQTVSYLSIGTSLLIVITGVSVYFHFFNSSPVHAKVTTAEHYITYTGTAEKVADRVLLKPRDYVTENTARIYKNDTNFIAKKIGRGQSITDSELKSDNNLNHK